MELLFLMSPEQIVVGGRLTEFVNRARCFGQPWFEAATAAKVPAFSAYIGEQLGWSTRAATEAMTAHASTLMGRMTLAFQAEGEGPFAANARRVLAGQSPRL
jgi:hypothetical protein